MAGGKNSKAKIDLGDRRARAMELRKEGLSYRDIAKQITKDYSKTDPSYRYSESQAYRDVSDCLKEINETRSLNAEEYRSLELERLDIAQKAIATEVKSGNLGAIDRWVRICERRSRLLGLDSPERIKVQAEVAKELEGTIDYLEKRLPSDVFNQVLAVLATDEIGQRDRIENDE